MGLVRKTFSISTLGLVNFRSKKELLRRAEADLGAASSDLEREHHAREAAEARIAAAEERAKAAELQTLKAAKGAARLRGKRGRKARSILDRLGDAVEATEPTLRSGVEEAGRRSRKAVEDGADRSRLLRRRSRSGRRADRNRATLLLGASPIGSAPKHAHKAGRKAATRTKVEAKRAKEAAEPYIERATEAARDLTNR